MDDQNDADNAQGWAYQLELEHEEFVTLNQPEK